MNYCKNSIFAGKRAAFTLSGVLLAAAFGAGVNASTIWTGTPMTYTHDAGEAANEVDTLTSSVGFTRGFRAGLYNAVSEPFGASSGVSPAGTEWAVGSLNNYSNLVYSACPLHSQGHPYLFIGTTYVVHLISDDIYFSLTLNAWGISDGGSFQYTRSTPAAVVQPPTVSISSPTNNATFAAPANVKIQATAGGGTVTNVQFFADGNSLGSVTGAPFNLTTSLLPAKSYSLTAVATAGGVSGTSAPVTINVVAPVITSLTAPVKTNGNFTFNYSATPNLTYVVQSSSNLSTWLPVVTNIPNASSVKVTVGFQSNSNAFFRVMRQPNP